MPSALFSRPPPARRFFGSWTLAAKLSAARIAFLLVALVAIGLTLWASWRLDGGAAAVNEAGRMRTQTYRLALSLAMQPDDAEARALVHAFDDSLVLLAEGDPGRPLFVPWNDDSRARFDNVRSRWLEVRAAWMERPRSRALQADAAGFVAEVDGFVDAIEAELARWTQRLQAFLVAALVLTIAGAVAMLYTAYRLVIEPVARLRRGVVALQQGDFGARVPIRTRDEFGELSAGFNEMAQALQALYGNLERKVQEKTRRLEDKRRRLDDLYRVSALAARAPDLDTLAQGFAREIRAIARADAAAVRTCDERAQHFHLLATVGLPEDMQRDEACLAPGTCLCAPPADEALTRIIPIALDRPMPLPHCAQAGFRAVISLPVRLHDRLLGEVDLYYRQPRPMGSEERELLETAASHLAGAIEGLRAAALEREAAVAEERSLLARELHDSIAQSLAFMRIQVHLLRHAMQQGDAEALKRGMDELEEGLRECNADVRELLVHFRTRTKDEDIAQALRTTLQKFEQQSGLAARLETGEPGVPLPPDVQVQVLHVVLEALSNVRKHARARNVVVRMTGQPAWRFEIEDDGVGFDAGANDIDETHVGLRIMQERAARIGATVQVESRHGAGCRVVLQMPGLQAAAPQPGADRPVLALVA